MTRKRHAAALAAAVLVGSVGLAGCGDDDGDTTDTTTLEGEIESDASTLEDDADTDASEVEDDAETDVTEAEEDMESEEDSDS